MAVPLLPKISTPPPLLRHRPSHNAPPLLLHKPSHNAPPGAHRLPALREAAHDSPAQAAQDKRERERKDEFFLNVGTAVRTLREDVPSVFSRDLDYDIYREDITFIDPLNTFQGIGNYRQIFWALRFHGRILFREIGVEVFRIWQPSEHLILIRWELRGIPRVLWEARGQFQGTSRYKVDRNGKIYEHKVDNLAFNFPRAMMRPATVLDLVGAACPTSPNLMFRWDPLEDSGFRPWVELYNAVRGNLDRERRAPMDVRFLKEIKGCI